MTRRAVPAIVLAAVLVAPAVFLAIAHKDARKITGLAPGQTLPYARLLSLDGSMVETRSWNGSPTLVVLFLSKCRACEREIEGLGTLSHRFPELRIVLLALDSQPPSVSTEFPVFTDPSGELLRALRKLTVPTLYLLDSNGKVVWVRSGQRAPKDERATLSTLLGVPE